MTEPEPASAFRRFPWLQLVFCLACLSMAAWTWMRYSYAWKRNAAPHTGTDAEGAAHVWPGQSMCRVRGRIIDVRPHPAGGAWITVDVGQSAMEVVTPPEAPRYFQGDMVTFTGRLRPYAGGGSLHFYILTAGSRFHPASTAGLVVGAMGVFVFGLYLRRWLRERAFAAQPGLAWDASGSG